MSPQIKEELLVLAMCGYGGLVLIFCYDVIRIFRRVFRASIVRVITEDIIFWTVASLFIFQIFFKYNYGMPRYYGVLAAIGTMASFEWLVGKRIIDRCSNVMKKIMKTLLKPLKKIKKVITIKSKSYLKRNNSEKHIKKLKNNSSNI